MEQKIEAVFYGENERAAVVLKKSERCRKPHEDAHNRQRDEKRKNAKDEVAASRAAGKVDELPEREWSEDLVLYFDELGYLELHGEQRRAASVESREKNREDATAAPLYYHAEVNLDQRKYHW